MGYYCTVPQCTSLAGKTKNVKFHRFPRDITMADKWNVILKRGKPYTKYSKVCSLHFTQADYNVTTMGKNKGQWKTLSKDAVPSQNLPKLNPDGTVMVIRKSRTIKYKEGQTPKKEQDSSHSDKSNVWSLPNALTPAPPHAESPDTMQYRLHNTNVLTSTLPPDQSQGPKPRKQDAFMQTDPVQEEAEEESQNNTSEHSNTSYHSETLERYPRSVEPSKGFEVPKDYTKSQDAYAQPSNEDYNKEAEKYALERRPSYEKQPYGGAAAAGDMFQKDSFTEYEQFEKPDTFDSRPDAFIQYQTTFNPDSAEILRNQQHNLQMLQHRTEDGQFFNENHIKQEIELSADDEKYMFERAKAAPGFEHAYHLPPKDYYDAPVKSEPDARGCESAMQTQDNGYYQTNTHNDNTGYYGGAGSAAGAEGARPGAELLIAKQNALAAHTQLWQNTMKRPFFYSDTPHYNGSQLLHTRYEVDICNVSDETAC